jgi:hypothetical protein
VFVPDETELIDWPDIFSFSRGVNGSQRRAENRIRAESGLVRRPVQFDQKLIDCLLIGGVLTNECRSNFGIDVFHGTTNSQPLKSVGIAVSKFESFEHAGTRTAGHDRPTGPITFARDFDFDRRPSAAVENFSGMNFLNSS